MVEIFIMATNMMIFLVPAAKASVQGWPAYNPLGCAVYVYMNIYSCTHIHTHTHTHTHNTGDPFSQLRHVISNTPHSEIHSTQHAG